MDKQQVPNHEVTVLGLVVSVGAILALVALVVVALAGCNHSPTSKKAAAIQGLTNTAPCYTGYCDANCPYRNNANYIGCGPNGTGPFCPSGRGVCRGIVLDK